MRNSDVDIVISTINQSALIDATISSIRRSTLSAFTLWILDQSADDLTGQVVRRHAEEDPRVEYRKMPARGIAATRNSGAALGTAPYILFTNSDCSLDAGWVAALVAALEQGNTWLAFGRVLPGPRPASMCGRATVLAVKDSPRPRIYSGAWRDLSFGHGHNMGARREAFFGLGGFDELHGAGAPFSSWDDLDIGYRALRAGGAIAYVPEGLAYHCHWLPWSDVWQQYRAYGIGMGAAVAKYLRCGDQLAWLIFARWVGYHGLRQIPAGLWRRNPGRVRIGLSQLIYPWLGLARGLTTPVDRRYGVYRSGLHLGRSEA